MAQIVKYPSDVRIYQFDFSDVDEIKNGQSISSATITATTGSGLTISTPVATGSNVYSTISSGTAGEWDLAIVAHFSDGTSIFQGECLCIVLRS